MSVNRSSVDEKKIETSKKDIFFRLLGFTKEYRKEVVFVIVLMMIASLILVVLPILTENAVDVQVKEKDMAGLVKVISLFIGLVLIWWVIYIVRVRIMARVANNVVLKVRSEAFAHLETLGLYYFDSRPTGKILSRLIGDITSLKDMLKQVVTIIVPNTFFVICILCAMFFMNATLAFGVALSLPIVAGGCFFLMKKNYPVWYDYRQKQSNLAGFVHEVFSGIRVIQGFTAEKETKGSFESINDDIQHHWVKAVRFGDLMGPVIDISQGVGYLMLYLLAIYQLRIDATSVGELIAFSTYIGLFWQPIRSLANMYNQLSNNLAGAGRVFEILDEKSSLSESSDAVDLGTIKGDVVFENVSFAYPDEVDRKVLEDVSFFVHSGEKIALVGPTGAGKTTIINLICRFYDAVGGRILLDGQDISKVTLSSLRGHVGVMTQESYLFSGSIRENVRYGRLDASDEEVERACALVGADSFIRDFDKGYETEIDGQTLSQGQKQLITLARTLLSDPKILILDEATSSIDTHTELLVQKGIAELMKGRTSFVVAHRLSTIRNSDRIFVINNKGIQEEGSHEELLSLGGAYAELYKAQFED